VEARYIERELIVDPYKLLGEMLREIRENLQELHPCIRVLVQKHGMTQWAKRPSKGWKPEDLAELSQFLVELEDRPPEIQSAFSHSVLRRLENGLPCNRRMTATYCYILGFHFEFFLRPVETGEREERAPS
jgi:hypothetical protein